MVSHSHASRQSGVSIAIKNFSPIWFLVCMDTGIISIIMNLLPWQFHGLGILATIMFVWNLVLFCSFTLLSLARLFKYPSHVKSESANSVEEMSYLAAPAIAFLTIVSQVSLTCSTAWRYNLTVLAYVCWWLGLVWTVVICSGVTIALTKRSITNDRQLSPAIFLPLISVMTLGTTGGLVTNYSVGITAAEAVPIIIVSFISIGYGLFFSLLWYAIYLHRLLAVGPPQRAKFPSLIITIGPLGQFATAIQTLGSAAHSKQHFAHYNQGTFLTASGASGLASACELLALLVVGFAFLWITVAWYLVLEALMKRKLPLGLPWWSMIFPMGVFTTALLNLSIALNSTAFRGLTAALLIILLIIYFFNLFFTIYRMYTGVAFAVPQQQDRNEQKEDEIRSKQNGHADWNENNV